MRLDKKEILKQYFGHSQFRPGQEQLIDALLSGHDVLGVMPTGGGKSICYQVPALLLPGMTVVISPLISLMKDQVMALIASGIPAACLNSSLTGDEIRTIYRHLWKGEFKILYIAPERLFFQGFLDVAHSIPISLLAVDEAHCVSQWGQDFRPSYCRIPEFVAQLPERPTIGAFTATATEEVRQDIIHLLNLDNPQCLVTGFDRPNLFFDVLQPENKFQTLLSLVQDREDKSGIIYCATRANVERVCEQLQNHGIRATRYHAGLEDDERRANQDDFRFDRCPVIVATNAFGMGIDKSNVGYVIHYNMPLSLESYYQEAGRAGRDGDPADCILLYADGDIQTAQFLIQHSQLNENLSPQEQEMLLRRSYRRLDAMIAYCKSHACFRGRILDYFGQKHAKHCHACGNCQADRVPKDITTEAQMVLSCVVRTRQTLGYSVGAALISGVLKGENNKRIQELGLQKLSTFGLMRETPKSQIRTYIHILKEQSLLETETQYNTLQITPAAREVLFHGRHVQTFVRKPTALEQKRLRTKTAAPVDEGLLRVLKDLRYWISQKEGIPAFCVFSNATLRDMASRKPHSVSTFLDVSGVGKRKAERYGKEFLFAISTYENQTPVPPE